MGKTKYVWEILKLIPHTTDNKKHIRTSELIVAENIQQIWNYISGDRLDERIEIESIVRVGPIVTILDNERVDSTK